MASGVGANRTRDNKVGVSLGGSAQAGHETDSGTGAGCEGSPETPPAPKRHDGKRMAAGDARATTDLSRRLGDSTLVRSGSDN